MRSRFIFLAYFSAFFLLGFSRWLGASFDDPTIDQILYHLHYSDGLGIDVGRVFLLTFAVECLLLPLLVAVVALMLHIHIRRWTIETRRKFLDWIVHKAIPVVTVTIGITALMAKLSVFSWAGAHFAQDRFTPHFVDAKGVTVRPVAPRNLVLIYVESLEDAYGHPRPLGWQRPAQTPSWPWCRELPQLPPSARHHLDNRSNGWHPVRRFPAGGEPL
jgi:phosphoglycerol transferase